MLDLIIRAAMYKETVASSELEGVSLTPLEKRTLFFKLMSGGTLTEDQARAAAVADLERERIATTQPDAPGQQEVGGG